jgi:GT2 family glycosyltransferase
MIKYISIKIKRNYVKILKKVLRKDQIDRKKILKFVNSRHSVSEGYRNSIYQNLSVIVPCYNHAKYLQTTFDSIIYQTFRPDEVIFIDDASTDNSIEVIENLIRNYSDRNFDIKLLKQSKNLGQAENLNSAISRAKNELIMILNDDDYLMHDAVENTLNIFNNEGSDIFLLGSKTFFFSNEGFLKNMKKKTKDHSISGKFNVKKYYPENLLQQYSGRGIDMSHSAMSFLKTAWQNVGGYYKNKQDRVIIYTDRDFQIRISLLYPIGVVEDAPFSFWRANSSVDSDLLS